MLLSFFVLGTTPLIGETAFVSTWDTTLTSAGSSRADQIRLPLDRRGTYDFVIDWGDDSRDAITSWDQAERTHTYAEPGVYTLTITGTIDGWRFDNAGDRRKLLEIAAWGPLRFGNEGGYFFGTENLRVTAVDMPDLSGTTSMRSAFQASGITSIPGLDAWDMRQVTDMRAMFRLAGAFDQEIGGWDVGNVTDMAYLFSGAFTFNADISGWDVGRVETMERMFRHAESFNGEIGGWDVGKVTDMSYLFSGAAAFNAEIGGWDVGRVETMAGLFFNAGAFHADISGWDVSRVTNMERMFRLAVSFDHDIGGWNVGNVKTMWRMFHGAASFNGDIGGWDVSNVTNMRQIFEGAASFNRDIGGWNVSQVGNMVRMFFDAGSFDQDIGGWDVGNVRSMRQMFEGAASFNRDIGGWNVSDVWNMWRMFYGASSFDQDIGGWDVGNVRNVGGILWGTTLSTDNYDNLLIGWAQLPELAQGVRFHGGYSTYDRGENARNVLIDTHGWLILDGGKAGEADARPAPAPATPEPFARRFASAPEKPRMKDMDAWQRRITEHWDVRKNLYGVHIADAFSAPPQVITELRTYRTHTMLVDQGNADSLIVHPDGEDYAGLAADLAAAIKQATGADVPVKPASRYSEQDRRTHLICLGRMGNNKLALDLYIWRTIVSDDWFPGPGGFEFRTVLDPWGKGSNVVMLGGSDLEGVRLAVQAFKDMLTDGGTLEIPYTIDMRFKGQEHLEEFIEQDIERLLAAVERRVLEPAWLADCAEMYSLTGRTEYLETYAKLLRLWLHDFYRLTEFRQIDWVKYLMPRILRTFNLVEHSDVIPEDLKLQALNMIHAHCKNLSRSYRIMPLGIPGQLVRPGHHAVHKAVVYGADYFRKYYPGIDRAAIELGLEKVRVGHETIAASEGYIEGMAGYTVGPPRAAMRVALALGDHAYFTAGAAHGWMHYIMAMTTTAGTPVIGRRRNATFAKAAGYYQDPAYMGYFNWIAQQDSHEPEMTPSAFSHRLWGYVPKLDPVEPLGMAGLNYAPLSKVNYMQIQTEGIFDGHGQWDDAKFVNVPVERAFQALAMRERYNGGQYLRLNGINDGILHHLAGGGNTALGSVAVIEPAAEDVRKTPALCDLQLASEFSDGAFVRSVLHEYNGVDWARNIAWIKGRYWVFFDQFNIREPGAYTIHVQRNIHEPEEDDLGRFIRHNHVVQFAGGPAPAWEDRLLRQQVEGAFEAGDQLDIAKIMYSYDARGDAVAPYAVSRVGPGRVVVSEPDRQVLIGVAPLADLANPFAPSAEAIEVVSGIRAKAVMFSATPEALSFAGLFQLSADGATIEADARIDVRVDMAEGIVSAHAEVPVVLNIRGIESTHEGDGDFVLDAWRHQPIAVFEPGPGSPFGDAEGIRAALGALAESPAQLSALDAAPAPAGDPEAPASHGIGQVFDTPLHWAAYQGRADAVQRLIGRGAEVDARDGRRRSALHLAASLGHLEVMRLLLEAGAAVDARGGDGSTALHWAVYLAEDGGSEAVRLLIGNGADVNARRDNGTTPLHLAAARGYTDIATLLIANGAEVDSVDDADRTPLLRAILGRGGEIPGLLVRSGANVNARRQDGTTPLHWAAGRNQLDVMERLLEAGAEINRSDDRGRTPLHWAAALAADHAVKRLLDMGVDVNSRDADGLTPLQHAQVLQVVWTFGTVMLDPFHTVEIIKMFGGTE